MLQEEIYERIRLVQELENKTNEQIQAQIQLRDNEYILLQQSRLAAMGEMIANIAHQWRQPLNLLGLLAQELKVMYKIGNCTEEYLNASVQKMMKTIEHMSQTIDDFRWFFKPDKDKKAFHVNNIITKTLSMIEDNLHHHRIRIEIQSECDPVVTAFPNEFSQALLNILSNASDALLLNKVKKPTIQIFVGNENQKAVVTITDNAGGIPEDIINKIFDPYFTTKGPDKGTGVGLYMSKTIIEKNMKGSLTARNVGDGAEFRIEI
jgi:C4-dicarboxylate-specific signal transduction histidine kinase